MRPGRILAVKWGMNPNSSSLGVDITFLLAGATVVSLMTPLVSALLYLRKPRPLTPHDTLPANPADSPGPAPSRS